MAAFLNGTNMNELITTNINSANKKEKFGNSKKFEIYKKTKDFVVNNKVLRLYKKEINEDGDITIILCNMYKLVKLSSASEIKVLRYLIKEEEWKDVDIHTFHLLKDIMLLPVSSYYAGERAWNPILNWVIKDILQQYGWGKSLDQEHGLSKEKIFGFLKSRYAGSIKSQSNTKSKKQYMPAKITTGIVSRAQWKQASRAMIKNIWLELIDKDILKAMCSMLGYKEQISLYKYIMYCAEGKHLVKHHKERKNLTPILAYIPLEHWKRDDIFSQKLWARNHRATTVIDRMKTKSIRSFRKKSQQKWVFSRSHAVISKIFQLGWYNAAEMLADMKIQNDLPYHIYNKLLHITDRLLKERRFKNDQIEIIVKSYLKNVIERRKTEGKTQTNSYMRTSENEIQQLIDWLNFEGLDQGFPQKNSTWNSLITRSDDWHLRVISMQRTNNLVWTSLISEYETKDYLIKPLVSSIELVQEGHKQHHCVGGYDYYCYEGGYRVFHIVDKKSGKKYTLGIINRGKSWNVQQVYGYGNTDSPKEIHDLSNFIAREYTNINNQNKKKKKPQEMEAA